MRKGYSSHFCCLDLGASALTTVQTATSTQQLKNYQRVRYEILQFRAVFEKSVHSYYSNTILPILHIMHIICLSRLDLGASALTTVQTATSTQKLKSYSFKKSEILQFRAVFEKSVHSYTIMTAYTAHSRLPTITYFI